MKIYITFGQVHAHRVNGKTFDCDSVAVIHADNEEQGRKKAFEYFGGKWHQSIPESRWTADNLIFYPRGTIEVEDGVYG